MLRFVTKNRYWNVLESGIMGQVASTPKWHLKDIQDAIAYSHLFAKTGLEIAEIGAGNSRLLPELAKTNKCYAIDEYKGFGMGPKSRPTIENVQFIDCIIGNSRGLISDSAFDIIFSVSVVEHVPENMLSDFFSDCWRILKPGGLMIHCIDVYTENLDGENSALWARCKEYRKIFDEKFSTIGEIEINTLSEVAFKTSYASNPDNIMHLWNQSSPRLTEKRKTAQSCTIELVGCRIPEALT